jgi:hypothetical protein
MSAASLGIQVTCEPGIHRVQAPISDHQLPVRAGDNTTRIMDDLEQESCRAQLAYPQDYLGSRTR